jgi:hypothetical protein
VTILKSLHCHPCNTRTYPEVAPRQFPRIGGAHVCLLQTPEGGRIRRVKNSAQSFLKIFAVAVCAFFAVCCARQAAAIESG